MALPETEDFPACLNKNISHPHLSLFLCPLPLAEKKYVTCFPAWICFPFPITNTVHTLGFLWVSDCYTHSNTLKFLPGFGGSQHKQRSSRLPLRWRTEVWEALLSLPRERIPEGKNLLLAMGDAIPKRINSDWIYNIHRSSNLRKKFLENFYGKVIVGFFN